MLTHQEITQYLERINFDEDVNPTLETLSQLHLKHLRAVPFENLDIVIARPFKLGEKHAFNKIVNERRGGFCYELNYGIYQLLVSLGFKVEKLSGRVYKDEVFGPQFDHLLLKVTIAQHEYLVDVGFGDCFNEPLRFEEGIQSHSNGEFSISKQEECYLLQRQHPSELWKEQYIFNLTSRKINDFAEMFEYHQYHQGSGFAKKLICSKLTPEGRITISNNELITTEGLAKEKREIAGVPELQSLLENEFGIKLPENSHHKLESVFESV